VFREGHPHDAVEAQLAARVRHPNVVAVHDLVQHHDLYCLVMDFHEGVNLGVLLGRRRRMPPSVVATLGLQLLAALGAVHESGLVHCDVKPANLLLCDDGRLILLDFGIAEISGSEPAHPSRRNGYVIGSPAYMPPELVRGGTPRPASDLWSLGAVLYTAVEGHPPFQEDDLAPTLTAVLHDPPPPARWAGRLQPLLERLLAKDPAARPNREAVHAMLVGACSSPSGPALRAGCRAFRSSQPVFDGPG
jgi:serine/threonine protein kinase